MRVKRGCLLYYLIPVIPGFFIFKNYILILLIQ